MDKLDVLTGKVGELAGIVGELKGSFGTLAEIQRQSLQLVSSMSGRMDRMDSSMSGRLDRMEGDIGQLKKDVSDIKILLNGWR